MQAYPRSAQADGQPAARPDELADAPVVLTTVDGGIVHRSATVSG